MRRFSDFPPGTFSKQIDTREGIHYAGYLGRRSEFMRHQNRYERLLRDGEERGEYEYRILSTETVQGTEFLQGFVITYEIRRMTPYPCGEHPPIDL